METKTINKEQMHDLNDLQEKLGVAFNFQQAALRLKDIVNRTPLQFNHNLSRKYKCNIF
jgi:threonine dehydratase